MIWAERARSPMVGVNSWRATHVSPRFHSFSFIQSTAPPNKQQNAFGMDLMLTLCRDITVVHGPWTTHSALAWRAFDRHSLTAFGHRQEGYTTPQFSTYLCPYSKGNRKDCADQSYHKRRCFPTMQCILDSVSTKSPPWTVGTAEALPLRFGENK